MSNKIISGLVIVLVVCSQATCFGGILGGNFILEQFGSDPQEESTNSFQPDENTTEASPAQSVLPKAGTGEQVLTLPGGNPPTLDPHLSGDATSATYVVEIFSGLVAYDPDLSLIPDIAEGWDVSDDATVYTFHLREEAQFHNGKPIRAQDFKWSFERACDFRTGSSTADTYLGDIIDCQEKLRGQADEVSGVEVIDDYTLQITIDAPKAYFLAKMSYPTAYVLDQENVERGGRTWMVNPNGSGPFKLEQFTFGEAIVLAKNEGYYREPMATLDRVHFTLTGDSAMIRYENDELDMTPVGINDIERVTDPNNELSADLQIATQLSVSYIGLNVNQPPFDDPFVRQAFNLALNKEKIVDIVFKETVAVANGIMPPGIPNYDNLDLVHLGHDPDKALELIYESSYEDPSKLPEITLYISGVGGTPPRIIEAIIATYKDVFGIEVAIQQTDWPTFLSDISKEVNPYQSYQLGWIADYPDPQNFLDILFHSNSRQNHTGYSNPDLDALLDEAGVEQDPEKRLALYQEAEQIIIQDAPWIPLYFSTDYNLVKPHVKGYQIPPMIVPAFQYVSIEK